MHICPDLVMDTRAFKLSAFLTKSPILSKSNKYEPSLNSKQNLVFHIYIYIYVVSSIGIRAF